MARRSPRRRELANCCLLIATAVCAAASSCAPAGDDVSVVAEPPVRAVSNFDFEHEGAAAAKVVQLREQEGLEQVVATARTDQELFEALTLWARRQFEPGFPDPYPLSNGLDILADIRSGKTQGFCGQYSYLLADALKSFGYFDVRYVETWASESRSHFLVEVWSNQQARWMLLDPLHAAIVVDAGENPLSTWDAHAVAQGRGPAGAHRKWLAPESELPREPDEAYFALFRLPAISLRNDLARESAPWSIPERQQQFLALRDEANTELLPGHYAQESSRREDFSAGRNLCRIEVLRASDGNVVRLANSGSCAHFWKFQIRIDGGDWRDAAWETLHPGGFRTIDCVSVNRQGVRGVVTQLAL